MMRGGMRQASYMYAFMQWRDKSDAQRVLPGHSGKADPENGGVSGSMLVRGVPVAGIRIFLDERIQDLDVPNLPENILMFPTGQRSIKPPKLAQV
jgi:hypothetical protein